MRWLYSPADGPLAQLVEQGTLNPKVEGSNPSRPTSRFPLSPAGLDTDRNPAETDEHASMSKS
jgi:hypothetical protein